MGICSFIAANVSLGGLSDLQATDSGLAELAKKYMEGDDTSLPSLVHIMRALS